MCNMTENLQVYDVQSLLTCFVRCCLNYIIIKFLNKKTGTFNYLKVPVLWRKERDSNPRYAVNVHTSSSRAP